LTRRRSSYRSLASLQRDNRVCRACAEAGYAIESRPVLEGHEGQRAYIFGQAPGVVEGAERRPWRGDAGQRLRRWLRLEEDEFYATFYCASVTRCYPGRAAKGGGDRTPAAGEQKLCYHWRDWELRLLQPALIVPVGGLAIRRLLGLATLDASIGERFSCGDGVAVPLPHPSGVSRWLNAPANQARLERAVELVHGELATLSGP
jgi:uracil-DNA glycosylase family 4